LWISFLEHIAMHVGLIADGNRRWANANNVPVKQGHLQGFLAIKKEILPVLRDHGVKSLAVYAFSTENWKRAPLEVKNLLDLFGEIFDQWAEGLLEEKIRLVHVGRKDRLPKKLLGNIQALEEKSKNFKDFVIYLCLDYGSEDEIVRRVNHFFESGDTREAILTEKKLREILEVPMLDLIIRTGGEKRLSNFCLYQASYAEFYFIEKFLPDMKKADTEKILGGFWKRDRRQGT
jgi:undecaprenyl diphosphate synthase